MTIRVFFSDFRYNIVYNILLVSECFYFVYQVKVCTYCYQGFVRAFIGCEIDIGGTQVRREHLCKIMCLICLICCSFNMNVVIGYRNNGHLLYFSSMKNY